MPEFLVNGTAQNLAKQANFGVLILILLYRLHDRTSPLNYEALQSVSLIQECEHVLLNRLPRLLISLTLLVMLFFGNKELSNQLLDLSK